MSQLGDEIAQSGRIGTTPTSSRRGLIVWLIFCFDVTPRREGRGFPRASGALPASSPTAFAEGGLTPAPQASRLSVPARRGELFTAWRYHAFITDSQVELVQAEKHHREHAIIEQVNAELYDSALAHPLGLVPGQCRPG